MKNEAKNNYESTELMQELYKFRIDLLNKDEQLAIDNILKRKCPGYLHFVNIADETITSYFTEGSVRWFQEIFVRDWTFIDPTGFQSIIFLATKNCYIMHW